MLEPASVSAGAASGFTLRVLGTNLGTGAEILFDGAARATTCPSTNECTAAVTASDVAAAGSIDIQVRLPGPPVELSNNVTLLIVAPVTTEEVITLMPAMPDAAGKDITVVDVAPVTGGVSNITLLGLFVANACSASGGPVAVTRPASGFVQVDLCLGGAEPTQTFTLSGPSPADITIINVQPLSLGIVQTQITLLVPSTAQPGLRTLFAVDANKNKTAASGGILVR